MTLLIYILYFTVGLFLLVKGADWLTDGAAAVAEKLGVPSIVVGLTIVAIGSSMPEFVVSVVSAVKGNVDIAVGNIVGSNIFNILLIVGITALVHPISMHWGSVRNDVPFVVLSSVALLLVIWDGVIERTEGLLLLCMFAIFMSYTLTLVRKDGEEPEPTEDEPTEQKPMWRSLLMCALGLGALLIGGNGLVDGGAGAARLLGMSESLVALTFVSMGTSAPELAASVMAVRKGDHGMALGNVVGSVVFNVFYVLGTAATVRPLPSMGVGILDVAFLLKASIVLWLFCRFGGRGFRITRLEGAVLVLMAATYYSWLIIQQG